MGDEGQVVGNGAEPPVLSVKDLRVSFASKGRNLEAISGVSFDIRLGESVGLVGESGSGKSLTALSILGLVDATFTRRSGQAWFDGTDLLTMPRGRLDRIRGNDISMIFQEPMTSLNPVLRVGDQMADVLGAHRNLSRRDSRGRIIEMLEAVGIPEPARRATQYPHELSGGLRQRVVIAMALLCRPRLLIADEPTTALDVTIQAEIIDLLRSMSKEFNTAVLLITHDLGVVAEVCSRMLVMYAGQLVEKSELAPLFDRPLHPYTSGLLRSVPQATPRGQLLHSLEGVVPSVGAYPEGCRFRPRCPHAVEGCATPQELLDASDSRAARCWRMDDLDLPGLAGGAGGET